MATSAAVPVIVGVDVGGTNTDAVVISKVKGQGHKVLAEDKHLTTADVTTGVRNAVLSVLRQAKNNDKGFELLVTQVNIGTTHFVNAVVQHKSLNRVAVIRLCGPASRAVKPFADFPKSLKEVIFSSTYFVDGGYRVDGREIEKIDRTEIEKVVGEIKSQGITGIVVCGIFAPTRTQQEEEVKKLIKEFYPEASVTLSHTIGHIGLLERENAAILNECLKELCSKTITGFRNALMEIGTNCPIFLTQNDGTVISEQQALETPVFTFASGPTNSMRGAAFLCDKTDAIVVDIGGTTTDVGVLVNRFPREASTDVRVGGVRTNFRMPDVHSIGLGGGSYVRKTSAGKTTVGPLSAGFNLLKEAFVFGSPESNSEPESGRSLTTTDIAVAAGRMSLGDSSLVSHLPKGDVDSALEQIRVLVEDAIDSVRVSDHPLPVILVGGGSTLLDKQTKLRGVSEILLPEHFGVANAIGAALSQVSGNVDSVTMLEQLLDDDLMAQKVAEARKTLPPNASQEEIDAVTKAARKPFLEAARDHAIKSACDKARQFAIKAGANPNTVQIVEQEEVALSYLPGSATRIKVKAVGDLADVQDSNANLKPWAEPPNLDSVIKSSQETPKDAKTTLTKQTRSVTGQALTKDQSDANAGVTWAGLTPSRPQVDPATGEWTLNAWDIECIAVGAGILGAGGGGNPNVGRVRAREAIENGDKIRIVSPERLSAQSNPDKDFLISLAFFGAPLVLYEQTTSGTETPQAFRCLQEVFTIGGYENGDLKNKDGADIKEKDGLVYIEDYQPTRDSTTKEGEKGVAGSKIMGVLCLEVGGMNSLEPLMVSAILDVPTVDADGMGRAFPMLQMFLPFIHGRDPYPTALANDKGQRAVILKAASARQVEDHFRYTSMTMGSAAGIAVVPIKLSDLNKCTVIRSFSRAWSMGDCVLRARRNKDNPLKALIQSENAQVLIVGKIRDVTRETSGAFYRGRVQIEGVAYDHHEASNEDAGTKKDESSLMRMVLDFQNENLVVRKMDPDDPTKTLETLAVVPDVISIMDAETAEPIPTEEVRYGQRVAVMVLPAPPPMTTARALEVVGPVPFGYPDVEFKPLGKYVEPEPLAPI